MPFARGYRSQLQAHPDTSEDPVKISRYDYQSAPTKTVATSSNMTASDHHESASDESTSLPASRKLSSSSISNSRAPLDPMKNERGDLRSFSSNAGRGHGAVPHSHMASGHARVFSMELSLNDPDSYLKCTNFKDNVPGYPCTRPRGFPHVLDIERYSYLNARDEFYQIPFLVDVASTLVWYFDNKVLNLLNSPRYEHGPRFVYTLTTRGAPAWKFRVERESSTIIVSFGERDQAGWDTVLEYALTPDGEWKPLTAESKEHGRYTQNPLRHHIETIGTAVGRNVMNIILPLKFSEPKSGFKEKIQVGDIGDIGEDSTDESSSGSSDADGVRPS